MNAPGVLGSESARINHEHTHPLGTYLTAPTDGRGSVALANRIVTLSALLLVTPQDFALRVQPILSFMTWLKATLL